jgi:hypothetical protein
LPIVWRTTATGWGNWPPHPGIFADGVVVTSDPNPAKSPNIDYLEP